MDAMKDVQWWGDVDGVVVLGEAHRIATPGERAGVYLDGRDVIVIQTKATRLNPYVFGQALLGVDLIRMRWAPRLRCVRSSSAWPTTLTSTLSSARSPMSKCRFFPSERRTSFRLERLRGAAVDLASQRGVPLVEKPRLTSSFRIDGVIVPSFDPYQPLPLAELVVGEKVTTVHSEASAGRARILGMWMSGEVIAAQRLLLQMGAADVHSIVLSRGDQAIEAALGRYASFEIVEGDAAIRIRQASRDAGDRHLSTSVRPEEDHAGHGQAQTVTTIGGQQRRPGVVRADAAQKLIPGRYCHYCGWPFPASRRQTQCREPAACRERSSYHCTCADTVPLQRPGTS